MVVEQNCRQQLLPNLHPMIKVCVTNFSLNNLKIVGSSTSFLKKERWTQRFHVYQESTLEEKQSRAAGRDWPQFDAEEEEVSTF